MQAQTLIRTYKGSQKSATKAFARDAKQLATEGYVPTSQSWIPDQRSGCAGCLLAIVFWPLLLIGRRGGQLTVTYQRQPTAS